MLKDIRFILVRTECSYVQSTVTRVISTEKFIVGVIDGRERDMYQVSDGKFKWAPRAWLLLSCV